MNAIVKFFKTWSIRRESDSQRAYSVDTLIAQRGIMQRDPMNLIAVARGIQLLQTSIRSLPLIQLDPSGNPETVSPIIDNPDASMPRGELIASMVADLAIDGNIFLLLNRVGNMTLDAQLLPAAQVAISDNARNALHHEMRYTYAGYQFTNNDVVHRKFMPLTGSLRGIGPIKNALQELRGMQENAEYASRWRDESGAATATLTTTQELSDEDAVRAKQSLQAARAGTPLVLGKGLKYERFALSPEEMQLLESRQFDITQVARMLGIPSNLLLASVEGSNLTYTNVEQSWIEFSSYTLQAYAMPICDALSALLPAGHKVTVDWTAARRSDTATQMQTMVQGVQAGILTTQEAREILHIETGRQSEA